MRIIEKIHCYPRPVAEAEAEGGTNDQRVPLPEAQMVRIEEQLEHLRSALADLESAMRTHFATKACVLGGVLGGMGIAAGVAATVAVAFVKLASP